MLHSFHPSDFAAAEKELSLAWDNYRESMMTWKAAGLEFGAVCHQWQARYKSQGSRNGKGFERLLASLQIPKSTAYRWIKRYEIRYELRANRHEVKGSPPHESAAARTERTKTVVLVFPVPDGHRQEFDSDAAILGGNECLGELFSQFLRSLLQQKATRD